MLKELINRVRGQVRLRVTCPYPERVLNLCSARKLAFWDLEWEGAETFTCRMSRGDYRILRPRGGKAGLHGSRWCGGRAYPTRWHGSGGVRPLAVGITACGAALLIGSFFVWDIQITGNETVPQEAILRALEHNGVTSGALRLSLWTGRTSATMFCWSCRR